MMNIRKRTLHLILASSASLSFIVCAYLFSGPFSFRPMTVDAATAESLLASYAAKDTDSDGLPDWQESLYGTDPANPESVAIGVLDGAAVEQGLVKPKFTGASAPEETKKNERIPGSPADDTITAKFARSFFEKYFTTYGGEASLSQEQLVSFTNDAVNTLVAENAGRSVYTAKNITVSGEGSVAMTAYIQTLETALSKHILLNEKSEIDYLSDAVEKNDASAYKKIAEIGASYTALSKDMVKIPVPKEAASAHLAVANSFAKMGEIITDISTASSDPLRSLVGLTLYKDVGEEFVRSLSALYSVFIASGVQPQAGATGYNVFMITKFASDKSI
jgi:hypothetical protein